MPRLSDPQLAATWKARLARFGRSQLTVAEFCEVEHIRSAAASHASNSRSGQAADLQNVTAFYFRTPVSCKGCGACRCGACRLRFLPHMSITGTRSGMEGRKRSSSTSLRN